MDRSPPAAATQWTAGGGGDDDGFVIGDNAAFRGGVSGRGGNDVIDGGDGNDGPLIGDHNGASAGVSGMTGDDIVLGGDGDDVLYGDNLNDAGRDSGTGVDTCDGGAGPTVPPGARASRAWP